MAKEAALSPFRRFELQHARFLAEYYRLGKIDGKLEKPAINRE